MDISMESFRTPDGRRGAVVRRRSPREIRTLTVFPDDGGLYHVETSLAHAGDLFGWSDYTYRSGAAVLTMHRDGSALEVDGTRLDVPPDTLPSHVASVLLEDMLAGCATEAELHRIDEGNPTGQPPAAHFSVGNPERVALANGVEVELGVADLFVADTPIQRFWFDSHEIVVSEWGGAHSYRVETVTELVDGVDDDVASIVRAFCG